MFVRPRAVVLIAVVVTSACAAEDIGGVPASMAAGGTGVSASSHAASGGVASPSAVATPPGAGSATREPWLEDAIVLARGTREEAPSVSPEELTATAAASNEFALDLYRQVASDEKGNVVVGPHSVMNALSMTYAGARGTTAAEMSRVLHLDEGEDPHRAQNALGLALEGRVNPDLQLSVANRTWSAPDIPFLDEFLTILTRDYGAPMTQLDFPAAPEEARAIINRWVSGQTNDRIPELMPAGTITADTRLVLTNAMYLDAAWHIPFEESQTRDAPFELPDGSSVDVPTMHQVLSAPMAEADGVQAVELLYAGEELSMVILIPEDLDAFESALDAEVLDSLLRRLEPEDVDLALPGFSLRTHAGLVDALEALGMPSAFDPGVADFSGMTGSRGLFISAVEHEAFVDVDESGTEAGAATGVAMRESSEPPVKVVRVDRPFLFLIRDRSTGVVLFVGRVEDPR